MENHLTAWMRPFRFHLTPISSNKKTGPIPVSTSSRATCDQAACPFFGNGCYAETGPIRLHWDAVTRGDRGDLWADFLEKIRQLPKGQLWRHNQAGDLYKPGTVVGAAALRALTEANRGRRGFTYSHHRRDAATVAAFKEATAYGFTVNASCQSEAEADAAIRQGLRAVFVVPSTEMRTAWDTEGGHRAIVCPAQRSGPKFAGMTCAQCQLCSSRPNTIAIAFLAHGSGRGKVDAYLTQ